MSVRTALRPWPALLAALLLAPLTPAADPPPGTDDWKYDVVYRKKGPPLVGLVLEQTPTEVRLKCITRRPGSPTIVYDDVLPRREVERVDLLEPAERERLQERLKTLAREREVLNAHLKLMEPGAKPGSESDRLALETVDWPPEPGRKAKAYTSTYFRLISTGNDEVTQLAAIHLEQVYAAYARCLPPRVKEARPTTVLLTGSLGEYRRLLVGEGRDFFNPAFYDVARNQVVCGCDLERLSSECERIRQAHAQLRTELEQRRAELHKAYRGKVPPELMAPITDALAQIQAADRGNDRAFDLARRRLFQRLYHEAFHAYLATFVYPDVEVPRWLNEGLAQIFETAIVEVGELRVGHADRERVEAVRKALADGTLMPLPELLRSGPKQFLVAHAGEKQLSDRYYLASWALAFHLTFERRLLGTKALDDYVRTLQRGTDPLEAFRDLVGEPLTQFEKEHLQYLEQLKPGG